MIRSALMKAVFNVLSSHPYLALEDFQVKEYQVRNNEPCMSITYRYNPHWYFNFHIPNAKYKNKDDSYAHYWFNCKMTPGREAAEETINAEERKGLLEEIGEWVKRLHEDIVSAPVVRQFEAHSSALEQLKERIEQLPDEPLSREDIAEFREGLDRIKAELAERLKQENTDKEQLRQKMDELSRDIEFLKQTLESMTKRQWGEILLVRVRKWKEKLSLRQIASGVRVLQKLLPGSVSEELDIVADTVDGIADVIEKKPQSDNMSE